MSLQPSHIRLLVSLLIVLSSSFAYSQEDTTSKIVNSKFPNGWDKNRNLRGRNAKILAWVCYKSKGFENKVCISIIPGEDSTGKPEYILSEMHTNKKPFNKWDYVFSYIKDYFINERGLKIGYWYVHLEIFNHKPTETELYSLIKKWRFRFIPSDPAMIEAGLDDNLWLEIFGFLPNRSLLTEEK